MKKRWVAAVLAGMITGAVLLSGCGGSSSAADSAGQEAAGADQQAGQEAENTGGCRNRSFCGNSGRRRRRP